MSFNFFSFQRRGLQHVQATLNAMAEEQNRALVNTCMVCGLSTFNAYDDRDEPGVLGAWLEKVVLLSDPDDELGTLCPSLSYANLYQPILPTTCEARPQNHRPRSEASPIEAVVGTTTDSPGSYRQFPYGEKSFKSSPFIRVFMRQRVFGQRQSDEKKHYLPIHEECCKMAERLWKTSPETAYVKDLRGMFLALGWRYTLGVKCYPKQRFEFPPNFRMGNDYLMRWGPWLSKWTRGERFVPTEALPGPAKNPMENINDVSINSIGICWK